MSVLSIAELRSGQQPAEAKPADEAASRPSLTALPPVRRRHKGLIAGVLGLLMVALGGVLTMNIHVANTQYQVVQMQNDYRALVHENEALAQQVQFMESPQSLSNAAVTLGMVMPAAAGTFDVGNTELVAGAEEASSSDRPSNFVAAAGYPGSDATAPADVADQVEGATSGVLGAGALDALISGSTGENAPSTDSAEEPARQAPGGGTIPAPTWD